MLRLLRDIPDAFCLGDDDDDGDGDGDGECDCQGERFAAGMRENGELTVRSGFGAVRKRKV